MQDYSTVTPEKTQLLVIDLQEKLVPAMADFPPVLKMIQRLLAGCSAMQIAVTVTEQYPRGLGSTIPEVAECFPAGLVPAAKTAFSVLKEAAVRREIASGIDTLIIAGIESDICVLQSALDALRAGYRVIVPYDAVTSRRREDTAMALENLRRAGCLTVSTDSLLFLLLKDAKHPAFKTVSKLVR